MPPDHVEGRRQILEALKKELVGPSPAGPDLDCSEPVAFDDRAKAYGPYRQKDTGEEILIRDTPSQRYGVGVLFPIDLDAESDSEDDERSDAHLDDHDGDEGHTSTLDVGDTDGVDPDDADLSFTNLSRPSAMAISFLAEPGSESNLKVQVSGGRYENLPVSVAGSSHNWWARRPVLVTHIIPFSDLEAGRLNIDLSSKAPPEMMGPLSLELTVVTRPYRDARRLITVCLVNRNGAKREFNDSCLFQTEFSVELSGDGSIVPYPSDTGLTQNEEEEGLSLLYRDYQAFATGHGCAADWERVPGEQTVEKVTATSIPAVELPSLTPEILKTDRSPLEISMGDLAGLTQDDGFESLAELARLYHRWIENETTKAGNLQSGYAVAARRHMNLHRRCLKRIKSGIKFLKGNQTAMHAFTLANHAVLLQQVRTRRRPREISFERDTSRYRFSPGIENPDPTRPPEGKGIWRPFQIAFILSCLESVADKGHRDRDVVELIWFPTGGGKTEAYLGLAAFSIFFGRLEQPDDAGVHVLMRYTLRLLSAQQFQRAAALICAMEHLRKGREADLGATPISIGLWAGGTLTPNFRAQAVTELTKANKPDNTRNERPPFVLGRCPWCAASLGPVQQKNGAASPQRTKFPGYSRRGSTVAIKCTDPACEFRAGLPVYVIDEDIYEKRPTLLIGTIDKFAVLAWRPEARAIFGIAADGSRDVSPPNIIIQDELHLISGPLGSIGGLYETVIENLCTDDRDGGERKPKIVCSTATIRRYADQIKDLYAREDVTLFPAPGSSIDDSFFASFARKEDGSLAPGKIYVGVHAPALRSIQTAQVRTMTSLLQAPMAMAIDERDPWWTVMSFFNSLRELGTTLSLLQSDIPDRLKLLRRRYGLDWDHVRRIRRTEELTSRLIGSQLEHKMDALEIVAAEEAYPVDVCLATSMIEVGIDIDRLSLMVVTGQPKSTSQYIQVTGRVGRSWWERPGLVVTVFSPTRPRDRSHFEQFRAYHEQLYAQVEPASVTPFSPPALDRALHAAMVTYVRQRGIMRDTGRPNPVPESAIEEFSNLAQERVAVVDSEAATGLLEVLERRSREWALWQPTEWTTSRGEGSPLMLRSGDFVPGNLVRTTWTVPTSMRNVDAECQIEITRLYLNDEVESDA